ncbi:4'-phosphopantetheinyl transferase superfamily protein [Curtobacterium sp. MCPF17_002]|uniref:4'-phosphopantetheinyl transferase family protein n=1 Tax=Curtobacterium sp. MCPF17_002 TaxID=2175645 RepID=UPI000DA91AD8|nr:4'-phosphopantetheinyl transferase superfamily protein [Curtobacterium sp. MCPF17_002]WIB76118.1 4'-phosphopantetheinyl transferase superfamily protein [Curtobacterium sp. MCPF17_002]
MSLPRLPHVVLTLAPTGPSRDDDREALLTAVASAHAAPRSAVRAGRVCAHCGGTGHGRPWAEVDGSAVGVGLARTPGVLALVVAPESVGVDVERVSRVAAAPLDAFTAAERERAAGDVRSLAACWAAKEAVLKRDGRGLRVDPSSVDVDVHRSVAVFEGVEHPLTLLFPEAHPDRHPVANPDAAPDLVVAVAAGGLPVVVQNRLSAGA